MSGRTLNGSYAPAEVDNLPDEFERDVLTWVRNWPRVEQAWEMFADTAAEYLRTNRDLNNKAGQKGRDRSLEKKEREALADLVKRTAAVQDFLTRRLG
jgi:hypothetical protein